MVIVKSKTQDQHEIKKKKKRTFFSSKLTIPISIPKVQSDSSKKDDRRNKGNAGKPSKGLGEDVIEKIKTASKDNSTVNKDKDVATPTTMERRKNITVYTSKSKAKTKAIIKQSSSSNSNSAKSGVIGRPRPIRATTMVQRIEDGQAQQKRIIPRHAIMNKNKPSKRKQVVIIRSSSTSKKSNQTKVITRPTKDTVTIKSKGKTKTLVQAPSIASKSSSAITSASASAKALLSKRILRTYNTTSKTPQSQNVSSTSNKAITTTTPSSSIGENADHKKVSKPLKKDYMTAGFYCQDPNPSSSKQLHNRILAIRSAETKASKSTQNKSSPPSSSRKTRGSLSNQQEATPNSKGKGKAKETVPVAEERPTFPPLPYDHGYDLFFKQQHDFVLPYYIFKEKEDGKLERKLKPQSYQKIRGNFYPERQKVSADFEAICKCSPESKCADQCINRIMSYLCGKNCPSGDECTNKTLTKRKGASYKVVHTGARGFGIVLTEDVNEGDFVMDYRGEVISIDTFMDRIQDEYRDTKNFYALAYDQDEVIDAGMKGNDARFINHGCSPNLEVRKYQTAGDGWDEFEVGMWALRDIKAGEELFYDYNFESFGVAAQSDELRTKCCCGAPNCIGFLGRKSGEKTAKELAAEIASKAAELARKGLKGKKHKKNINKTLEKPSTRLFGIGNGIGIGNATRAGTSVLGLEATPSIVSNTGSMSSTLDITSILRTPSEEATAGPGHSTIINPITSSPLSAITTSPVESPIKQKRKVEGQGESEIPKKKSRKSEPAPSSTSVITKGLPSNISSKPQPKKSRKSEPLLILSRKQETRNPRISMDLVREAAKIKKAENIKARGGAPKGWVILPVNAPLPRREVQVVGSRKPPRDRSSLG